MRLICETEDLTIIFVLGTAPRVDWILDDLVTNQAIAIAMQRRVVKAEAETGSFSREANAKQRLRNCVHSPHLRTSLASVPIETDA